MTFLPVFPQNSFLATSLDSFCRLEEVVLCWFLHFLEEDSTPDYSVPLFLLVSFVLLTVLWCLRFSPTFFLWSCFISNQRTLINKIVNIYPSCSFTILVFDLTLLWERLRISTKTHRAYELARLFPTVTFHSNLKNTQLTLMLFLNMLLLFSYPFSTVSFSGPRFIQNSHTWASLCLFQQSATLCRIFDNGYRGPFLNFERLNWVAGTFLGHLD